MLRNGQKSKRKCYILDIKREKNGVYQVGKGKCYVFGQKFILG